MINIDTDFSTGYVKIPNVEELIKNELIADLLKFHNSIGIVGGEFDIKYSNAGIIENAINFDFTCSIKDLSVDGYCFGNTVYEGEFVVEIFTKKHYFQNTTRVE